MAAVTDRVVLRLSEVTVWCLASAANEASIYSDEDRALVGAPSEERAEELSDGLHGLITRKPYTMPAHWSVPVDWLPEIRRLIPHVRQVLDDDELGIRSSQTMENFDDAQSELLFWLRSIGHA